jgi:hypothetical protein
MLKFQFYYMGRFASFEIKLQAGIIVLILLTSGLLIYACCIAVMMVAMISFGVGLTLISY